MGISVSGTLLFVCHFFKGAKKNSISVGSRSTKTFEALGVPNFQVCPFVIC